MGKLASEVNARLDGGSTKSDSKSGSSGDVCLVKVTCDALNIRKGPGTGYAVVGCIRGRKTYTIVGTPGNWGRLKPGAGWICLDYTSRAGSAKASSAKAADIDAMARAVIRGDYGNGEERRRRLGSSYAAVQKRVNQMLS
mgnify:CR=1 FL=1